MEELLMKLINVDCLCEDGGVVEIPRPAGRFGFALDRCGRALVQGAPRLARLNQKNHHGGGVVVAVVIHHSSSSCE